MSMRGKVVLITGSTSGLGLHTGKALYREGAIVIVTSRDETRGRAAVDEILSCTVNEPEANRVFLMMADLSNYRHLLSLSQEIENNFDHIDVLICNAGIMGFPFELSTDGIEMHFATNAFSHFVLVNQLLPLLENSEDGRIVIVGSGLYKGVNSLPTKRQLMGEQNWDYESRNAYAVSKLANLLHVMELQRRLLKRGSRVRVYAVRPGFVRGTNLGRETHWILRSLAAPVIWAFSKHLDEGIESIVHCATASHDELSDGHMYHNCQEEDYNSMITPTNSVHMWDTFSAMEDLILRRNHEFEPQEKLRAVNARSLLEEQEAI